jgi:molecular chaperone GrpE
MMSKKDIKDKVNEIPEDQTQDEEAAFVAGAASDIESAQQIGELTAHLQRLQAEFDNYRRRVADQQASVLELAKQDVVLQLLPLIDNVDRALAHVPEELKDNAWAKGVAGVAKQASDTFTGMGVSKVETVGQPFDHNSMEAIAAEGEGDQEEVSEELQAGYKLGEKVIRPAMVKVIRK